jgi:hypothetical protein
MQHTQATHTPSRRRAHLVATALTLTMGLLLSACAGGESENGDTPATRLAFVNVRSHLPGASTLNIECPDDVWSPVDKDGRAVLVSAPDGNETTDLSVTIGETVTVTDPLTGNDIDLLCVPGELPEFENWIGEWVGMGLTSNLRWQDILKAFLAGGSTASLVHEIVVDPYGVIRSYRPVVGVPSAMEQDPVTGGLISQMDSDQRIPDGSGGPWPLNGAVAPGTPAEGSYIVVRGMRPGDANASGETLRLEAPPGSFRLDGHDFVVNEKGNYLVLGYELTEESGDAMVVPSISPKACRERAQGEPITTLRTRIVEYDRTGGIVKVWRSEDHLSADIGPSIRFGIPEIEGKRTCVYDLEHANAIDIDENGNIVIGFRNAVSTAILIDWVSGDVLWTLGGKGPKALTIEGDEYDGPLASHDATVTRENGVTHLAIFDNNSTRGRPRYIRYAIDETNRTATLVTEIPITCSQGTCYSMLGGSSQVFRGAGEDAELLINPGGIVTEDIVVPIDGQLLHYKGDKLINNIPLGAWWLYRATVYTEEPWSQG